jgi:hypothetical protein
MIPGKPEIRILCLQWYARNSEAKFWSGSHRKKLEYREGKFGIYEVLEDSLKQEGIGERIIPMPHGGL